MLHVLRASLAGLVMLVSCGVGSTLAATAWDETASGDLSNNRLSPTPVGVAVGSNVFLGSVGNGGSGVDRDYFTFTVPAGATLSSIKVLDATTVSGSSSFFAIQAGPQITVTPTGVGVEQLIGYTHYGYDNVDTNLLTALPGNAANGLPAGTYSVWVQETGGPAFYGFDFVITAPPADSGDVPTLPEWGVILLALALAGNLWRRGAGRLPA